MDGIAQASILVMGKKYQVITKVCIPRDRE